MLGVGLMFGGVRWAISDNDDSRYRLDNSL